MVEIFKFDPNRFGFDPNRIDLGLSYLSLKSKCLERKKQSECGVDYMISSLIQYVNITSLDIVFKLGNEEYILQKGSEVFPVYIGEKDEGEMDKFKAEMQTRVTVPKNSLKEYKG